MPSNSRPATTSARLILLLGTCVALAACSAGNTNDGADADTKLTGMLPGNDEIMTKVYAPYVSKPAGFYVDPRTDATQSYTIHHLKNSLIAAGAFDDFELCADDMAVAMDWSEQDSDQRAVSGELLTTAENDLYYEFVRPLTDVPEWINYGRVFKCSFVDRGGADSSSLQGSAGQLTKSSFTSDDVRRVGEYLWSFSRFHNTGNAVLQSGGFSAPDVIGHTLTIATLRRGDGDQDGCDAIDVSDWELRASISDGQMAWSSRDLFSFDARLTNGVPEVCASP